MEQGTFIPYFSIGLLGLIIADIKTKVYAPTCHAVSNIFPKVDGFIHNAVPILDQGKGIHSSEPGIHFTEDGVQFNREGI